MDNLKSREDVGRRQVLNAAGFGLLGLVGASLSAQAQQGAAPSPRSAFEAHKIDHDVMEKAPLLDLPFSDGIKIRGYSAINQPNCQVIIEDFFPGDEFEWQFPHDEIQYCLSGSMQLTVWSPPLYAERVDTVIEPGTLYNYPIGTRKRVKVLGDEPFRHICFCPPSPNYPFPTADDVRAMG